MQSVVWVCNSERAGWGWLNARKATVRLTVMDEGGRDDAQEAEPIG